MSRTTPALVLLAVLSAAPPSARAADPVTIESTRVARPYYVGSSLFMLANLIPDDHPPVFFQLNAGLKLTDEDRISVEAITWRYYHPLGIPYGSSWESPQEEYPGHVREYGVGVAYQRMLWRGLFASIGAVPMLRRYHDRAGQRIGSGFQLFATGRVGYQIDVTSRVFIEPSIAFNYWTLSTNRPAEFEALDRRWPSYFLFEPGLHAGVRF